MLSDELQTELLNIKEKFKVVSEKIRFNFNINSEANKSIIEIAVIKGSPVYFNRPDNSKLKNHNQLVEWMENAKKQALYWIVNGNIPSPAMYNQVYDILTKYRYDEECADILEKLTALKAMTSSKK